VVNNYYATQNDISNAIYNLNNAITIYTNAQRNRTNGYYNVDKTGLSTLIYSINYAEVSLTGDGYDIPRHLLWTTQSEKNNLDYYVQIAKSLINDNTATIDQINNAHYNLSNAISNYNNRKVYGFRY